MIDLERAVETEAHRVKPMVCSKVARTDINDVMQDIRLSFFTAFPRFRGESALSTYSHGIAQNKIMDYFRKKYGEAEGYKRITGKFDQRKKERSCTLTGRQKAVLRLVGEGMNNIEIAEVLGSSVNTVRCHLKAIYRKLQCRDRVRLALFSYKFFKERTDEN